MIYLVVDDCEGRDGVPVVQGGLPLEVVVVFVGDVIHTLALHEDEGLFGHSHVGHLLSLQKKSPQFSKNVKMLP